MEKKNEGQKTKEAGGRQESSFLLAFRGVWLGGQKTGGPVPFQSAHPAQAMKMQIRQHRASLHLRQPLGC